MRLQCCYAGSHHMYARTHACSPPPPNTACSVSSELRQEYAACHTRRLMCAACGGGGDGDDNDNDDAVLLLANLNVVQATCRPLSSICCPFCIGRPCSRSAATPRVCITTPLSTCLTLVAAAAVDVAALQLRARQAADRVGQLEGGLRSEPPPLAECVV